MISVVFHQSRTLQSPAIKNVTITSGDLRHSQERYIFTIKVIVAQSCAKVAQSCAIFQKFILQHQLFFVRKLKTWSVLNVSDIRIVSGWSEIKAFIFFLKDFL